MCECESKTFGQKHLNLMCVCVSLCVCISVCVKMTVCVSVSVCVNLNIRYIQCV